MLAPLVYHRICLTGIEIFRLISIYFDCGSPSMRVTAHATLNGAPKMNIVIMKFSWLLSKQRSLARAALALGVLLNVLWVSGQSTPAKPMDCRVESVDYKGWHAQQLSNRWVQLIFVPQNGGRLIQVVFAGHPYLFVNPKLAGKYLPPSSTQWFNYGGDKLWLLPEGSDDEQHWPGNSDVLDDGPFSFRKISEGQHCEIEMTSPADPQTGIQFIRNIRLDADSPRVGFRSSMKNITGHSLEWSMQSVSQYDTSLSGQQATDLSSQMNRDFHTFTPANPHSSYLNRYHVRFGPAENPAVSVRDDNLFTVHYVHMAAELWIDSTEGWLAVVDGTSKYAMVERFRYEENKPYPGKASVIFWTNGPEMRLNSDGQPSMSNQPDSSPYYLEAELNSPMCRLRAGESCTFETEWFPTRSGSAFQGVADAGIMIRPLQATATEDAKVKLSGAFGVFYSGQLIAHFYDEHGRSIGTSSIADVTPTEAVELQREVTPAQKASRLSIHLVDENGLDRGALQEVQVSGRDNH